MPDRGREFTAAHPGGETLRKRYHGLFPVASDELLQGSEQGRMGEALSFDPGKDRLGKGFGHESERDMPIFAAESFVGSGI